MIRPAPRPPLFPYTTLFRSYQTHGQGQVAQCPVTQTFLAAGMPGGHDQDQGHAQGHQHQRQGQGICVQLGMHGADSPCPTPWGSAASEQQFQRDRQDYVARAAEKSITCAGCAEVGIQLLWHCAIIGSGQAGIAMEKQTGMADWRRRLLWSLALVWAAGLV